MAKRLFVVHVEFEFAVLADNEDKARDYVAEALRTESFLEDDAGVVPAKAQRYCLPDGWEGDELVYGADSDVTWDEAVEAEKTTDASAERIDEFNAKQIGLPIE